MKKIVSLLLCLALVLGLSTMALADGEKTIYILTPTEDHGWTGSVATFAKMSADEINAAGTYKAEVKTAASAARADPQIEDIIANNAADVAGVVILPQDDTVEFAIQQLVDANIPYVAFDRIIAGVKDSAVANVKGDNAGVGKAVAEYFISLGMKAGDEVIVFEGDTSSVTADRDAGFTDYLKEQGWTEDDLAKITFSGAMNWSRSAAKEYFESLMSDSKNASIKWFYSQDDEFAMGIMEALKGSAIDDATKQAILDNKIVISAAGGSENLYKIMRGEDAEYADLFASFGGLAVATYSPAMIQDAVKLMVESPQWRRGCARTTSCRSRS